MKIFKRTEASWKVAITHNLTALSLVLGFSWLFIIVPPFERLYVLVGMVGIIVHIECMSTRLEKIISINE